MFALEVEFLMGRILASGHEDRRATEWPPHPSRIFSALVAAYEECDLGSEAREVLKWLEALPPPALYANPPDHEGWVRDVHSVWVPVNDSNDQLNPVTKKRYQAFSQEIGLRRNRQERWFPAFTPRDRHVWVVWNEVDAKSKHEQALQHIAENVTYIGHSMSPARVRVWQPGSAPPPAPTLAPHLAGTLMLRTIGEGRLEHLENVYRLRKENATIQPRLGRVTAYRTDASHAVPASLFRHRYVFRRVDGTRLALESAAGLVAAMRRAVIGRYPDPVPEVICGHDATGRKTDTPHLAIAPLADVGHRHADGHIMGLGFWLPASTAAEVRERFEDAMAGLRELKLGKAGIWEIEPVDATQAARVLTLRLRTYERPSDTWASVTPVIFGKYPKRSQVGPGKDGGKVFAEMCEMIGLPRPVEVRVGPVCAFRGAPKAADFAPPAKFSDRLRSHVWIRFPASVRGPLLLGAGRFVGFGLCRPWRG
jgi:CRISPR-associated protein Csb2